MRNVIDAALSYRWISVQEHQVFKTPDNFNHSTFSIADQSATAITIRTQGGTNISINRAAFIITLLYLLENNYYSENHCPIGSDKDLQSAGPLCVASRQANGTNVMVITYILPILVGMGLVKVNGTRPNTTWIC